MANESSIITQFTPEVLPLSGAKRIRNNILGTLLFVVLINAAVHFYLTDYTRNLAYWLVHEKWRTLQTMEEPLDWVIVGDSSGNQAVVTSVFEEQIGGSAYNFASAAPGVLLNDAWMLETYLERFGAPKGVVMVHIYDIWPRIEQDYFLTRIPVPISQWDDFGQPVERTPRQIFDAYVLKYVPIYSQELTLKSLIPSLFWGRVPWFEQPYMLDEGGYWREVRHPSDEVLLGDTDEHIKWTDGAPLKVAQVNRDALEYMIALSDEYGFDLYFAISPLHDELYAHENFQGYYLQFQQMLDAYAEDHQHFYNLGLITTFPTGQGITSDHVYHEGALAYSEALALKILETR